MADSSTRGRLQEVASGLYRFDTHYLRPGHTACYIAVEAGRAALIDCGVTATAPALLAALDELGLDRGAVEWLVATHVHIDHTGGAGRLLQSLPNARVAVHPSGAAHLIDPTQLAAGVRGLYGDDFFEREYDPVEPVEAARIVETPDEQTLELAGRPLQILYTPGHAWHHFSVMDHRSGTLVAGDAFGVGYAEMTDADGPFVLPVVPPPQFKPEVYKASVERIVQLAPARVAVTHFDIFEEPERVGADLCRLLDAAVARAWQVNAAEELYRALFELFGDELERRGRGDEREALRTYYDMDIWLTAEGIWLWRKKQEQKMTENTGGQGQ